MGIGGCYSVVEEFGVRIRGELLECLGKAGEVVEGMDLVESGVEKKTKAWRENCVALFESLWTV